MRRWIGVAAVLMAALILASAAVAEEVYLPLVGGGTVIEQPGSEPSPNPGPAPEPPVLALGYSEGGQVGRYYVAAVCLVP